MFFVLYFHIEFCIILPKFTLNKFTHPNFTHSKFAFPKFTFIKFTFTKFTFPKFTKHRNQTHLVENHMDVNYAPWCWKKIGVSFFKSFISNLLQLVGVALYALFILFPSGQKQSKKLFKPAYHAVQVFLYHYSCLPPPQGSRYFLGTMMPGHAMTGCLGAGQNLFLQSTIPMNIGITTSYKSSRQYYLPEALWFTHNRLNQHFATITSIHMSRVGRAKIKICISLKPVF